MKPSFAGTHLLRAAPGQARFIGLTSACRLLAAWALTLILALSPRARAQAPGIINHIGFVRANGIAFEGPGQFKFALVSAPGTTTSWSNAGTSVRGSEPTSGVTTSLSRGIY